MALIVYYVTLFISSFVMSVSDYGMDTWQWWVIILCLIGSHIAGRERKK